MRPKVTAVSVDYDRIARTSSAKLHPLGVWERTSNLGHLRRCGREVQTGKPALE